MLSSARVIGQYWNDESDGSFLKLPINYSIITNIDYEHLDFYKNYKNLENSFVEFINKTPPTGKSIVCIDNVNIRKIFSKIKNKNIITYGESKIGNTNQKDKLQSRKHNLWFEI